MPPGFATTAVICVRTWVREHLDVAVRSSATAEDLPTVTVADQPETGIASRARDLLKVRALPDRMRPEELARAAGLRFEWQGRRYRDQARRFSMEELLRIHGRIADADRALKSGASEEVVLPVLVSSIAGEPAA